MICLFLFVICAMFSECWFEQMDRGRKGQEKDGEESEMNRFDIFVDMVPCFDVALICNSGLLSWGYLFMCT